MDPKVIGLIVIILLVVGFMAYRSMSGGEDPELSQAGPSDAASTGDADTDIAETAQVEMEDVVPEGAETVEEPVPENEPSVEPKQIQGLVGWFTGDSWDEENQIWVDLSDAKNDATEVKGSIVVDSSNFANNNKFLIGGVDAGIRFPQECLTTGRKYTMFTVARYNGTSRQRIFTGVNGNFFSGFHAGSTGGAYRDGSQWIAWNGHASDSNRDDQKFIVHTDTKAMLRRNGIRRSGLTNYRGQIPRQMSINYGSPDNERSDWAVAEVIFFKGELPASEYKKIETYLFKKYMIAREIRPTVHTAQTWGRYENFGSIANTGQICGDEGMLNNTFLVRHRGANNEPNGYFDFRGDCIQAMDGGIEDKNGQLVSTDQGEWWDNYGKLINMDCKDKAISGYAFEAVGDKNLRNKFSCHNAALNKQSCYAKETALGQVGSGNIMETLDNARIACDSQVQAMTKLELVNDGGQLKYKYRCCNLEDL